MDRINFLEQKVEEFEENGQIVKSEEEKGLANAYMDKARHNLLVMEISQKISTNDEIKKILALDKTFNEFDWVVIKGYYSMYMAALACLAKIGIKSENHVATSMVLELIFVHKKKVLESKYIELLNKIRDLEARYITMIITTRQKRRTAQYDAGIVVRKPIAVSIIKDARKFVDRIAKLFNEIK
ncbi:MAG: hypothetical protein ISS48_00745 [Candidatus Aenigmarchaeota archaeon]|nr:hypothetical protein [Candidatus Aenigmarchaeota archaeon]